MKSNDRICHRVPIKSEKERELYKKRQEKGLQGTPKIILGKAEANLQEIWCDDLKNYPINRLKEVYSSERGHIYAKKIVATCYSLSQHYGFFMINENMIFLNSEKDIFTWINPDIRENHVKIYLPKTPEGQTAMIKSIINYLKLWFKCDYTLLTDIKSLAELSDKISEMKINPSEPFRAKSPEREFLAQRRNSINLDSPESAHRAGDRFGQNLLADNKSMKDMIGRSPNKESQYLSSSISNKMSSPLKFNHTSSMVENKNRTTLNSDKNEDYEHRTFNNMNTGTPLVSPLNKSLGMKGGNHYYPNKTTSNKANSKHHIVALINQQDTNPNQYGKNKILLDDKKMSELEQQRTTKKESLDGIGQELDGLFTSTIENQEQDEEALKKVEEQFSTLLE